MASVSPTPNSSPSAVPPVSTSTSAPPPSTTTTTTTSSLPPQSSSPSPDLSTVASPSQLIVNRTSPPSPQPPSAVPPSIPTPQQPVTSPPPPPPTVGTPTSNPPPSSPPPPPPSQLSPPPVSSPPPAPPRSSPPPPASSPPPSNSTPPTPTPPPQNPPPPSEPPASPPVPPVSVPPPKSLPPPPATSPVNSPPPPANSTPPISAAPTPSNALPPPRHTSPPPSQRAPSPSPSNSTRNVSPSPPLLRLSPPPPSIVSPPSSHNNTTIPSAPESSNSPGDRGISTVGIIAIGAAVGVIMLSLFGLAVWCIQKRTRRARGVHGGYIVPSSLDHSPRADSNFTKAQTTTPLIGSGSSSEVAHSPNGSGGMGNSRSWFTYEELLRATNGFSSQNLLGEGGFGSVYKGCLPDGREVAVKQLKVGGGQGEREFKAEVEIISRIHHRHLVSLVGYCIADNHRLLVYDYVPNNTLHFHLHGEGRPVLDWTSRVKIAAGVARGIAYLHEDCHPRIIHRDIKLSNILLDNNFEAKVSDFGLAKLALDANTHVTTRVMGTFGYMAPEYASSGKLTEKSDVFSFGVVLLELITGRKAVDASQPTGDESLVQWARPLLGHALANEEFDGLVDPRLEKNYIESEMLTMIGAAAACVRHSAAKRPRMGQVVRALDGLASVDLSNGMRVGESEVYNAAQSAEIRLFRRMAFGNHNSSTDIFNQISLDIASTNSVAS